MQVGVTLGNASSVGAVGATLGGGVGHLARSIGLGIDCMVAAEVVLADGTIVVADDENEHASLLYALRGGGGNMGVVTSITLAGR